MRNPIHDAFSLCRTWRALRPYKVFALGDAALGVVRVLIPNRIRDALAGLGLRRHLAISTISSASWKIDIPNKDLHFLWPGPVDNNLFYVYEQEFDPRTPHCYDTPPIHLTGDSTVLDVGACEGLFAFRMLVHKGCRQVIAFEPMAQMRELLQEGARSNGVADRLRIEGLGLGRASGYARFEVSESPDAGRLTPVSSDEAESSGAIPISSLDDYCASRSLVLGPHDLIKIDAEGADLDVLIGAERTLREGSPQVAVTTYHVDDHAERMIRFLRDINPKYQLRLKGFSFWTERPRPVLLQAALPSGSRQGRA